MANKKKKAATEMVVAPIINALGRSVATSFNRTQVVNLDWAAEKRYALALLSDPNNDYLLGCALDNPASVGEAMLDLGRLGLSLSPVMKQAYLIPYRTDGVAKVTLAPSYIGMEQAVLRSEKVKLIQTELVYEKDEFRRWVDDTGPKFMHVPARKDRGNIEGAYCLARFANGESHLEYMSAGELEDCHKAALRKNNNKDTPAWKFFGGEMRKKCVVRRGAKHWPSDRHIETLMKQLDKMDPVDWGKPDQQEEAEGGELCLSDNQVASLEAALSLVPEASRSVWVLRTAEALGYPGGPLTVPDTRYEELMSRLLARQEKVYGAEASDGS